MTRTIAPVVLFSVRKTGIKFHTGLILITEANAMTDFIVTALVDAWECGELTGVSAGEIWKGRLSLGLAQKLNALAIRMLNHDQPWRRRSARTLVQLALHCKEYVIDMLER